MWFVQENFLKDEDFIELQDLVQSLQYKSLEEDDFFNTTDYHLNEKHGRFAKGVRQRKVNRVRYNGLRHTTKIYENNIKYFGEQVRTPLYKFEQFFKDQGIEGVILHNLWIQYTDHTSVFHRHRDGGMLGYPDTECFTSILYTHKEWNDEWGGILKISDSSSEVGLEELNENIYDYSPKPNTMITWSRDHPHWVTPINSTNVTRSFFGACWYRDINKKRLITL